MPYLPDVAVLPSKRVPGLGTLSESPQHTALERLPLIECFEREWATDAHFVTYGVFGPDGQDFEHPRLNKSVLAELRAKDCEVYCTMLVLDYDNPGHAEWTDEALVEFVDKLEAARAAKPHLFSPTAVYTTRHGARLVYVLEAPVPADVAELRLASLVRQVRAQGILVDQATKDWTRLFRLPKVVRDDVRTSEEEHFLMHIEPDALLGPQHVPATGNVEASAPVVRLEADMPGPEEAEAMLWTAAEGKSRKRTEWYNLAKRSLKGRDCYEAIFEGGQIATEGERNPTVMSYAGSVVSLMFARPGTTAEKCFALLAPAVMQLEGDDGGRSWLATLWHAVKHAWEREAGKAKQQEQEAERAAEASLTTKDSILKGVRQWAGAFGLPFLNDDDKLWEWARERMIIAREGKYMVLSDNGFYNSTQVRKDALAAHIRRIGMDEQMDFWLYTEKDGDWIKSERAINKILSDHLSTIDQFIARPNVTHVFLEPDDAGNITAVLPMYYVRGDATPKYDPDVDDWLRALGGREYEKLCNWIGHALDFSRPIAALSILGTPSCGKQLLVRGLAECINTRMAADGGEMVGDYQFAVRWTPFLNVNEGWPKSKTQDPADMFRRWTGGDPFFVNAKFQVPVFCYNPLRIILTANNDGLVKGLTRARNLTLEDRDAIATRLFHLDASDGAAARYLREKGGMEFTRGWIDAADGTRGDDRVARHFLYLYQSRDPVPHGNRLLVEGSGTDSIIVDMTTESGIATDVIETVLHILENPNARQHTKGFSVDEPMGAIYVTATPIVDYWHKIIGPQRKNRGGGFHHRAVGQVLRTIKRAGWSDGVRTVKDGPTGKPRKARWFLLDNMQLLIAAENNGFDCEYLLKLMGREE